MAQPNQYRTKLRFLNFRGPSMGVVSLIVGLILFANVTFCNVLHYAFRIDSNTTKRNCIISISESQAHVKEATNQNDAKEIYEYFAVAGYKNVQTWKASARPWCAVYVHWVFKKCGVSLPKGNYAAVKTWASLRTKYPAKNGIPRPGDVVTYKPYSHAEIVKMYPIDPRIKIFYTNGGNTTAGNSRQGVYLNIPRPKAYIMYIISIVP